MSSNESFRESVRQWLETHCPPEVRCSAPSEEYVWGGRKEKFLNPYAKQWFEAMRDKGWLAPTWPVEYGGAGLTEQEAKNSGRVVDVEVYPWAASGRAQALGRTEGLTKWLVDPETHRVLGCGIVGAGAGELIAEAVLAIEMGCEAADIGHTIHPHPTLSESVGMAAEVYEGTITDLYIPKKK